MRNLQITHSITDTESSVVSTYLLEVARTNLIGPEEEAALARRIKTGDAAALEKLIKANLRFVISVAKKYQGQGLPLADLISEGNAGLIKAARLFDETRGFRFISFAVWWIRQSIMLAIAEQTRMVRLPMNRINLLTKMKSCAAELEQRLSRTPEIGELAEFMEAREGQLYELLGSSGRTISFDVQIGSNEDYTLIDQLWNEEHLADRLLEQESSHLAIAQLLGRLTPREREVVELCYGLNGQMQLTPEDIAGQLGITTERVRQLKRSSVQKMAAMIAAHPGWFDN
ncbi:sigma-70 family RNA polymerase sigma factor [Mucilaginibacter jinjuensis]|uniref:RNA polymerase sigma factor RpoD/SigA n=1 Tax=Mucilaginibacter jinjuensis TaxID=1176721 RepID=A0ABY7TC44_9SPHI|nr:RNA polymerase sigma factor RpoD/SigA [Mucilaginibacter jinjuensis]WCT14085.1 RNA polymerase sigma factor RpoD/SigA [Mucilaginibacter jinjuensis]